MNGMEIEYEVREDDVVALYRNHYKQGGSPLPLRLVAMMLGMAAPVSVAGVVWILAAGNPMIWDVFKLLLIACVAVFLALLVVWRRYAPRWMLRQGKNAQALGRHRLTLTPERFVHTNDYSTESTLWSALERIAITNDHAFFYTTTLTAHILPRRAFADDRHFEEFTETARQYYDQANLAQPG
jgi:membrane protein implicated in regulation of membrane protease activity